MNIKINPIHISLVISLFFYSCSNKETSLVENTTDQFYQTFNERQDFEKFLSFYAEEAILEDIVNGDRIEGKEALKNFFDWTNPDFQLLEDNSLVVSEQIIQNNKAVVQGYFTPFKWGTAEFEAMHFTTILSFNEEGKIIKQVDWINYPATLVNYNERKNANEWIE